MIQLDSTPWYKQPMMVTGVIIGVLLVGGLLVWRMSISNEPAPENMNAAPQAQEPTSASPETSVTPTPITKRVTKKTPPKVSTTYQQALAIYGDAGTGDRYRFQFDECSGNPGELTMKVGSKFMIDNRDDVTHSFIIGTEGWNVGPWGFKIATASRVGDFMITCEGGGAAKIHVLR